MARSNEKRRATDEQAKNDKEISDTLEHVVPPRGYGQKKKGQAVALAYITPARAAPRH